VSDLHPAQLATLEYGVRHEQAVLELAKRPVGSLAGVTAL